MENNIELKNIMHKLKERRLQKQISGSYIARKLGMTKQQYHAFENGNNGQFEKRLQRVEDAFGLLGETLIFNVKSKK